MKNGFMINKMLYLMCFIICFLTAYDQKRTSSLKIMSYNIKHGVGMDEVLDLTRTAELIKLQAPDLCALQEIDNFCLRSNSVGQTDYLALATHMTGVFGKFMDYQGGEYGMASLSVKPLISTKHLQLPDGIYEPRSAIIQEVQIAKECVVVFVNVHLDWIEGDKGISSRLNQAEVLLQYIDTLNEAVVIIGDFNCTPDSPTMNYFYKHGFEFVDKGLDNVSFQGENKAEIDHIVFRNTKAVKIEAKSIMLLDEPVVSDHRPLIVELEVSY